MRSRSMHLNVIHVSSLALYAVNFQSRLILERRFFIPQFSTEKWTRGGLLVFFLYFIGEKRRLTCSFFLSRKRPCQSQTSSELDSKQMKPDCSVSQSLDRRFTKDNTTKANVLSFVYLFVHRRSVLPSYMGRTKVQTKNFASPKNSHWGRV